MGCGSSKSNQLRVAPSEDLEVAAKPSEASGPKNPNDPPELLAQQADGHAHVVMKDSSGRFICKIPNGERLVLIREAGADYVVQWALKEGLVKKDNCRTMEHSQTIDANDWGSGPTMNANDWGSGPTMNANVWGSGPIMNATVWGSGSTMNANDSGSVPHPITHPAHTDERPMTMEEAIAARKELLVSGAVRLISLAWLMKSFVKDKQELRRRQDLPEDAFLSPYDRLVDIDVAVISHGWLRQNHPDPDGVRRSDIRKLDAFFAVGGGVFWDYLSLFQLPRSAHEDVLFKKALDSMHLIYSNPKWTVYQFLYVPPGAATSTPYDERGWCFFESCVSAAGAKMVDPLMNGTLMNGPDRVGRKTLVPKPPKVFQEQVQKMHFTSKKVDLGKVCELYTKVWPTIAKKNTDFRAWNWDDEDAEAMLAVLPQMPNLVQIQLRGESEYRLSDAMKKRLREVLESRGGMLVVWCIEERMRRYRDGMHTDARPSTAASSATSSALSV